MAGLFGEYIDQSVEEKQIEATLTEIDKKVQNIRKQRRVLDKCVKCSLRMQCSKKDQASFAVGLGHKKILIILDSPDLSTKATGNYRAGTSYQCLSDELYRLGLDLERDCWITYSVRTYVEKATDAVISACKHKLLKTISTLKPAKIITLGSAPFKGILSHRSSTRVKLGDIDRWAGWEIPDQELEAMVFPIYDPEYVQWMDNQILEKENIRLFRKAIKSKKEFYKNNYLNECGYIDNEADAIAWIRECVKVRKSAFDYETTGIKWQRKGHKIICIGISNGLFSYGFEIYNSRAFKSALAEYLQSEKVVKIAHNAKYEAKWTKGIFGYSVKNWGRDTMNVAHVLDNRKGITGLKLQAYVATGHMGYDNEMAPYMETTKPGDSVYDKPDSTNSFNMMAYAPIKQACLYCAQDAHLTYKLDEIQTAALDPHRSHGVDLMQWSTRAYVRMETAGVHISMTALLDADKTVTGRIFDANQLIQLDPDVAKWRSLRDRDFDYDSDEDLKDFIYEYMREPILKRTKKNKEPSVDKDVLKGLIKAGRSKVYGHIETHRKWTKVKEYIDGIRRETVNRILHCSFNLNFVTTYRTSSSDINLQNIPKRDKEVKAILRAIFIPRPGRRFIEYDFKAFEVAMYACYSQDEALMEYVKDLTKDMHRDIGAYIMKLNPEQMVATFGKSGAKLFRQETKSGFVFSQLYGSGTETNAKYYWEFFKKDEGIPFWEDFSSRTGITTYEEWKEWIAQVEDYFWHQLFPKLGEWRENNWNRYTKTGRIKYFTGFYVTAMMKKTQATNYPIQGTASSVKLAVLAMASDKLKKDGAKSTIFAEIHDSICIDMAPGEEEYLDNVFRWIVDVKIPQMYPWAIVPFYLEKSRGDIDGSWATVEEIGIINERSVA